MIGTFILRRRGHSRPSLSDWLAYGYLALGFLVIVVPVLWLVLNSVKTPFQIERQDISFLPGDYERVARATVYEADGRQIFIIGDLPDWALDWRELSDAERASQDIAGLLASQDGVAFYALRSHLGEVERQARSLIKERGLADWLLRYPTMPAAARAQHDLQAELSGLSVEENRLLAEFLGLEPYKPGSIVAQVLVDAPHPETGEMLQWAVPNITPGRDILPGRALAGDPGKVVRLPASSVTATQRIELTWSNYLDPLRGDSPGATVDFGRCITNSVLVTVIATLIMLLINSMAAFALSKYRFRGQVFFLTVILATLLVPPTIALVGLFKAISFTGLSGSIWGVIIPGAATPAGVFMLRQYMLTIPEELIEAARMDEASEWKIYWKIVLPLTLPALAALGILSVVWRWNDLILPLVAIATVKDAYTIQLCLLEFQGEHTSNEHYRLAMTVVSLIPTTVVFVFLQRYITTGIANTGLK